MLSVRLLSTVHLFKLKTYHEVVDEIYYQVKHLEPWERGSRKTAGQTGMCGGVSMLLPHLFCVLCYACKHWTRLACDLGRLPNEREAYGQLYGKEGS